MKKAHFFDLTTLIEIDSRVWIVSKDNPNNPIMKITESEFNLIKRGIYKNQDNKLDIDGKLYWFPDNLIAKLKVIIKKRKLDITNISFSLQEWMNPDVIENLDYKILKDNFRHLKNTTDDIYIICSKNSKRNLNKLIEKLESELNKLGLIIKDYYFLSQTFYNRDKDEITYKKVRLLLQHLVGYKTDGNKFTNEKLNKYNKVHFYDTNNKAIELANKSDDVLNELLADTEDMLVRRIKKILRESDYSIITNLSTGNKIMPLKSEEIIVEKYSIIKKFNDFKN